MGLIAARAVTAAATLGVFEALVESGPADRRASWPSGLGLDPGGRRGAPGGPGHARLRARRRTSASRRSRSWSACWCAPRRSRSRASSGAQSELHWDVLRPLDDAIRTGEPYRLHEERQDDPAWEGYMRGLFEISRAEQDVNAALVPVEDARSLVDVAGGHGGFSMAMCRRFPEPAGHDPRPARGRRRRPPDRGRGGLRRPDRLPRGGRIRDRASGDDRDVVSVFNLSITCPRSATASWWGWPARRFGLAARS